MPIMSNLDVTLMFEGNRVNKRKKHFSKCVVNLWYSWLQEIENILCPAVGVNYYTRYNA